MLSTIHMQREQWRCGAEGEESGGADLAATQGGAALGAGGSGGGRTQLQTTILLFALYFFFSLFLLLPVCLLFFCSTLCERNEKTEKKRRRRGNDRQRGEKWGRGEQQGRKASSSPAYACPGEEEDLRCRSKRHRFGFFFGNEQYMKRRCFAQNVPFHLNGKWRQNITFSNQSFNLCAFFHFGPWFRISSIKSLIGHQTSIFMQLSPWFDKINSQKL